MYSPCANLTSFCASQHKSPVITSCCTSCIEGLSTARRFMSLGHVGILRVLNFVESPHLIVQLWDYKVCRWRMHRMTSRLPVNLSRYSARDRNREMWPTSVVSVPLHSWKNGEGRNVSCRVVSCRVVSCRVVSETDRDMCFVITFFFFRYITGRFRNAGVCAVAASCFLGTLSDTIPERNHPHSHDLSSLFFDEKSSWFEADLLCS
jgi:hypothetical protein